MEIIKTDLNDLLLLKPKVFQDNRGFFLETYSQKTFSELGIETEFIQDNHSMSVAKGADGIVTPMHPGAIKFWKEKGVL